MTKKLVEYELDGGQSVIVEVDDPSAGPHAAATYIDPEKITGVVFEQALDQLKPLTQAVVEKLKAFGPQEYELEFGVKLSGKVGVVLASAQAEGNFKVTLKWSDKHGG